MIEMRRTQLSFGDGLIAEEVSDLRESWMKHADAVLANEDIVAVADFRGTNAAASLKRTGSFEFWRKVVSPTQISRRGQVVRPNLDHYRVRHSGWGPQG